MTPKILGGPERKALRRDNVKPVNFSSSDPYWDLAVMLDDVDQGCRSGEIKDLIVIRRTAESVSFSWRGEGTMATAAGMMEFAKIGLIG